MKKNMGGIDRMFRILVAVFIGVLYFSGLIEGVTAIIAGVVALIFVVTSFISFCPLYAPFGFRTCKRKA